MIDHPHACFSTNAAPSSASTAAQDQEQEQEREQRQVRHEKRGYTTAAMLDDQRQQHQQHQQRQQEDDGRHHDHNNDDRAFLVRGSARSTSQDDEGVDTVDRTAAPAAGAVAQSFSSHTVVKHPPAPGWEFPPVPAGCEAQFAVIRLGNTQHKVLYYAVFIMISLSAFVRGGGGDLWV